MGGIGVKEERCSRVPHNTPPNQFGFVFACGVQLLCEKQELSASRKRLCVVRARFTMIHCNTMTGDEHMLHPAVG